MRFKCGEQCEGCMQCDLDYQSQVKKTIEDQQYRERERVWTRQAKAEIDRSQQLHIDCYWKDIAAKQHLEEAAARKAAQDDFIKWY